eukprot:gene19076-biopygen22385
MHCLAHVRTHHGAAMPGFDSGWDPGGVARYSFHGEYRCALAALDAELGPDESAYGVLGFSLHDAMQNEQARCQKTLSRAVLAREHARWKGSLDPASRALVVLNMASGEGRRPLASEWLLTPPFNARTTLPDTEYQVAVRLRLDVPLCDRGDPCKVLKGAPPRQRNLGVGRSCGAPLLPNADHAQACATRARDERHDAVADMCAAIYREAGLPAHRETEVPGVLSSTKKQPIRADVLARARAPATWQCAEVKVRHFFTGDGDPSITNADDIDAVLRAQEARVHGYYGAVPVRPWVITSLGRPGEGLCGDLRRLARQRLQRPDVSSAVSLPSVMQFLLHRWRAELSCTLALGNARVYLAAIRGELPGHGGAPAPVDVHLYDMQSLRATF